MRNCKGKLTNSKPLFPNDEYPGLLLIRNSDKIKSFNKLQEIPKIILINDSYIIMLLYYMDFNKIEVGF